MAEFGHPRCVEIGTVRSMMARFAVATTAFNASSSFAACLRRDIAARPRRGVPVVRFILGITLLLLGVGTLSCRLEQTAGAGPTNRPAVRWVRTVDGWERPEMWRVAGLPQPGLHPVVVALGQGLVSVLGLVASRRENR